MRVVYVSKALVRGAYQRKLEELARRPGVELTLITPPAWTDEGHRVALERRFTNGYDLIVSPIRFEGRYHRFYYPGLGSLLRRLRPDVVHADEEPYNLATLQTVRAARLVGARCLFFTWQNLYRRLPLPFWLVERYVYSRVDRAIAGNRAAVTVLRRKGFAKPCVVIPQFGVDPELFVPARPAPPTEDPVARVAGSPSDDEWTEDGPRPFVVGYLGRLIESKGLLDLLAAVAKLPGDWRLELVGAGPLRETLERRAGEQGLGERIRIRPEVSSTEVPRVLRSFDALVLPSRTTPAWKEQFGRVLVEAMACAVPVVGSDSGEIPNVIGDAGLVFREGEVGELRAALAGLAANPAERARLGALGRRRALERYTQSQIAESTYQVYREMIGL